MKIKMFSQMDTEVIEQEINEFLSNDKIKLIQFIQTESPIIWTDESEYGKDIQCDTNLTVTIIYE